MKISVLFSAFIILGLYVVPSPLAGEGLGEGTDSRPSSDLRPPSPAGGEGTSKEFWQHTTWTTTDGVKLVGLYHPSSRQGANTWVLLHGLGSSKGEWDTFAKKMANQGDGSFIYDARGHADSVQTTTGETLSYKSWQTGGAGSPWDAMPSDLASAVQMLHARKKISEKRIAVGGASLGANVALVYASQHPLVPALILLSPGVDYAGIQTAPAYAAYRGRPVFIAASPGDLYAYSSVRQLTDLAPSDAQVVVDGKTGHGVNMFDDDFTKKLLDWMKKVETH